MIWVKQGNGNCPDTSRDRFLLKYASRDEVELLDKGNGGIVEVRNAIEAYGEPSPLFGYLRYRRRNVILKYVPEDCSRLVKGEGLKEEWSPESWLTSIQYDWECNSNR